ncbi:hypothetical protein ABIA30_000326 [Mycobacterium sp. MAA66]|uniref:hypothetical protein n=1 Tax=Mycobacterium sp. MAA66 TaxID=3156297 RepID=UPI003514BBCB
MRVIRAGLAAIGLCLAVYGATLLSANPQVILIRILTWALAAVLIHDAVFAPLCVAVGFAGRKLLPERWQAPVAVAALCSVVLLTLAVPVFDKPGRHPDNSTVLDRNYHAGLWISLTVVWVIALGRLLPVRKNEVVERQGTDDVESEPPTP